MIPCGDIDNPFFKEGGLYYDYLVSTEREWLCPEDGNLVIAGIEGTNLWAAPIVTCESGQTPADDDCVDIN